MLTQAEIGLINQGVENELLRRDAEESFYKFCVDVLGHKVNAELGWADLPRDHKDLCDFLQNDPHLFKLVLMPRFTLKSCICTIGKSLFEITKDPNIRILIYSESSTRAQGFLEGVKNNILGKSANSKIRDLYGALETDPHKGKWNESQIIISTRRSAEKEPTIDTGGIESAKVGMHYDIILFDDIVSDLNVTTKAQMDKVYDCYKKSLSLLKPGGKVVVVGTRWNFGDAYGRMIDENQGDWGIFIRAAEVNGAYPFESIGLTEEFLRLQRIRQGSYIYSCLYLNSPVDDSTALFKHDDFEFYGKESDLNLKDFFITCTCDPAGEGEDFSAFTVIGTDKDMRMYVLYASAKHYKPNQIIDEIIRLSYGYHFTKFGIETRIFNGMLDKELDRALAEERKKVNFTPFSTEIFPATCRQGEGKHARISSLQPYHERRHLLFPGDKVESLKGNFAELAAQMMQYTASHKPIHDDLLDSLAYHVQLVRPGTGTVEKKVPENTIAYYINQETERINRMQKRLPLKYRRYYEPVF